LALSVFLVTFSLLMGDLTEYGIWFRSDSTLLPLTQFSVASGASASPYGTTIDLYIISLFASFRG